MRTFPTSRPSLSITATPRPRGGGAVKLDLPGDDNCLANGFPIIFAIEARRIDKAMAVFYAKKIPGHFTTFCIPQGNPTCSVRRRSVAKGTNIGAVALSSGFSMELRDA
jgi:hypothetical protein